MSDDAERSRYCEFVPPRSVRSHVLCFWTQTADLAHDFQQRIIPDGCVDLVWPDEQPPFVAGPDTAPRVHELVAGGSLVGLRLRPGRAGAFLGFDARELLDRDVPLRDLWRRDQYRTWAGAGERPAQASRLIAVVTAAERRLAELDDEDDLAVRVATWLAAHPFSSIAELDQLTGLSERQLRRRFETAVGYGPKMLQRVLRLQFVLWLASREQKPVVDLASLAATAGYADQSHLTREVSSLTGSTPGKLRSNAIASTVSDLFKTRPWS